jgi:hypothetical protein
MLNPGFRPVLQKGAGKMATTATTAKKTNGAKKSTGNKKNPSESTALARTNGAGGKQSQAMTKKTGKKKSTTKRRNPMFSEIGRTVKATLIGTAGGIGSKIGGALGLRIVENFAPSVTEHSVAKPIATAGFAWFATPRIARIIGFSQQSAEIARTGGLIAAGFDAAELLLGDVQSKVEGQINKITGNARRTDRRDVATNSRTAIGDGAMAGAVAGAQAGAAAGAEAAATPVGGYDDFDNEMDNADDF